MTINKRMISIIIIKIIVEINYNRIDKNNISKNSKIIATALTRGQCYNKQRITSSQSRLSPYPLLESAKRAHEGLDNTEGDSLRVEDESHREQNDPSFTGTRHEVLKVLSARKDALGSVHECCELVSRTPRLT